MLLSHYFVTSFGIKSRLATPRSSTAVADINELQGNRGDRGRTGLQLRPPTDGGCVINNIKQTLTKEELGEQ